MVLDAARLLWRADIVEVVLRGRNGKARSVSTVFLGVMEGGMVLGAAGLCWMANIVEVVLVRGRDEKASSVGDVFLQSC